MEIFSTSLKGRELHQMSTISSEVKYQINRMIRYPICYPKKKETALTVSL